MSESVNSVGISRNMFIVGIVVSILASSLISAVVIPNLIPKGWHEIASFAEEYVDYRRETEFFNVPSDHWRIHWTVMTDYPAPEKAWFRFYVELDDEGYHPWSCVLRELRTDDFNWTTSWSGVEYVTGSGRFSIEVVGNAVLWGITVESYH